MAVLIAIGPYFIVRVRERDPTRVPAFDAIRSLVRADYMRRRGEEGLLRYVAALRENAEIEILDADLAAE